MKDVVQCFSLQTGILLKTQPADSQNRPKHDSCEADGLLVRLLSGPESDETFQPLESNSNGKDPLVRLRPGPLGP